MLSTTSLTSQTMLLQELSVWLDEIGIFVCDHGGKVVMVRKSDLDQSYTSDRGKGGNLDTGNKYVTR